MDINARLTKLTGLRPQLSDAFPFDGSMDLALLVVDVVHERLNDPDLLSSAMGTLTLVCRGQDWIATFATNLHEITPDGNWWDYPECCRPCGVAETPASAVAQACLAALEAMQPETAD